MVESYDIPTSLLQLVSAEQAYHYNIIPYKKEGDVIEVLTDVQENKILQEELEILLGNQIVFKIISKADLQKQLSGNYRQTKGNVREKFKYSQDFLEKILITAKEIGSSDIHFEPYEHSCRIRFRLDGKLIEQYTLANNDYPVIANKIKIKANLDIAEKRLPQDGRITIKFGGDEFDIRVSSLPTLYGEKIVLRILSRDANNIALDILGFNTEELSTYLESIKKPNGIVLISGPTGSGKTTTLYATLKEINKSDTNILTIEDPIEYTLEGVNQVQLKENIGLDFATALRTFLRQDPDVIMVGEIRDEKTANMAIRASLTGHLVLSTIHTNSAWATVSRLIDMGVPPFLIASTLNVSVAQRLVRKLCTNCKKEVKVDVAVFPKNFIIPSEITTHNIAVGCSTCYQTGYQGRKAIYEILPITKEITTFIKTNELEIDNYLKEHNIATLKTNAIALIAQGVTSVEEVYALLTD